MLPTKTTELQEVPVDQILKWEKGNDIWVVALIQPACLEKEQVVPVQIQEVLEKYIDVFSEPKTFPPTRAYDHAINLIPRVVPVNSRPYRYSPLQ